jgi:hypothetical protein
MSGAGRLVLAAAWMNSGVTARGRTDALWTSVRCMRLCPPSGRLVNGRGRPRRADTVNPDRESAALLRSHKRPTSGHSSRRPREAN